MRPRISVQMGSPTGASDGSKCQAADEGTQLLDRPGRHLADMAPPEQDRERLRPEAGPAAGLAWQAAHEPENVPVPASREDLLHHRENALVDALLARLRRDAAPAQARLERVLPVRDPNQVRPVQHDGPLLVGQRLPRRVHVEAVRPAHLVEDVDRHLRVDDVAGGRGDDERTLPDRLAGIGDEQLRVEPVLHAEAVAGRARPGGRIEREQAPLDAGAGRRRSEPRVQEAQVVVKPRQGPDGGSWVADRRPLIDGNRRRQTGDRAHRRPGNASEELAGVRGEGFEVAALRLATDGIERQRGLAGSGNAGDDRHRSARNVEVDRLEIVFARTAYREHVHDGYCTASATACSTRSPNTSSPTGCVSWSRPRNSANSRRWDGASGSTPVSSSRTVRANSPKC